ncbi:hypothetical protein [Dyadobacter fanqingshengii]|uniref:Outer membrane beta-barrel protein n=1 Tax=Dyadobacter fanqingshengii TaxID=2906443 RepID=A0A9X1TA01_9BACT|nr:hypothetical protein [Dyadobacter fanqingshengii]MCF0041196.1 hypothetical protein [Dyadobacter fanqingshengii]USJ37078.1 hypothetical protein NFI81_04720 [Dyadobacter fanqingshengii]
MRFLCILILSASSVAAQPLYTRIRGAFGAEIFGIAPKCAFTAEAAFGYGKKTFWNVQAGVGAVSEPEFRSPAFSAAVTHCLILNPYKRKSCIPQPGYRNIETYFEAGLGSFFVDRYDRGLHSGANGQRFLTPAGIAGLRFALVTSRWIYILKLRYAPPLIANPLASHVGAGIAVGWR